MSAPEHAAATARERNDALDNWLAENCNKCLKRHDCGIHEDILLDLFCDGLQKPWELALCQAPCPLKWEKASLQDAKD